MKRMLGAVVAAVVVISAVSCCAVTAEAKTIRGDLNGDNNITLRDASFIQRISTNIISPTVDQRYSADFNEDGQVSAMDAYEIQKLLCNMTTSISKYTPNKAERIEFIELINADRVALGRAPFDYNDATLAAGTIRAKECINGYTQTRPNGSDFWTVLGECNLTNKSTPIPWQFIGVEKADGTTMYNYIKNSVPNTYEVLTGNAYTTLCVGCVENSNDTAQWVMVVN